MNSITKNNRNKLLLVLLAVVLAGLLVLIITKHSNKNNNGLSKPSTATAAIRITEDGFQSSSLKIKAGTTVVWTNDDTEPHRIASNPYPTHKDLPSLDSKSNIDTNGTYRYTFKQQGTFGYHDELHPEVNGAIIVE
jgi:plastocyanin